MNDPLRQSLLGSLISRRRYLFGTAGGLAATGLTWLAGTPAQAALDDKPTTGLIAEENGKPGATDWQLTRVRADGSGYRSPWIEGYCSRQSVEAGETIEIMVSTDPPRPLEIEIFRMGYYGGRGARRMAKLGPFEGKTQPTPSPGAKNIHECRWEPTTTLTIPADWPSGVYLGRLTTLVDENKEPYWQSYVVFVVRDERPADILFQCSDNTWQAYNRWPSNYSLYTHPKGGQGPWADVSFDRPYGREAQFVGVVNDPLTVGSGEFLPLEFPLAYWLEQHGYDVSYCTNSDMISPDHGLKCKAWISVGHDEYWDIRQYESVKQLRDAGINLLFLSGNTICWVTPFRANSDGRPNRVIFRAGPYGDRDQHAIDWDARYGPFPERGPDEGLLMGARNPDPDNGGADWVILKPDHWMFEGTGVKQGDRIPGLVGWEYHANPPDIPGLEIVAAGTAWQNGDNAEHWTATIYPGPKGNFVFNASTIFWAQGLSSPPGHTLPWSHWSRPHGPDERVERITHNLLRRALGRPAGG
jgi:hypothetical protein